MSAQTLFDPKKLEPPFCLWCNTTRKNLCQHDADVQAGYKRASETRPKTCLNRHDPSTARIPF